MSFNCFCHVHARLRVIFESRLKMSFTYFFFYHLDHTFTNHDGSCTVERGIVRVQLVFLIIKKMYRHRRRKKTDDICRNFIN